MLHYAIPLVEKNPDYVTLHVGTNDAPYKAGSDISNEILELMRFIKEKYRDCKKITLYAPIIRTDNCNANQTRHISPTIVLLKNIYIGLDYI